VRGGSQPADSFSRGWGGGRLEGFFQALQILYSFIKCVVWLLQATLGFPHYATSASQTSLKIIGGVVTYEMSIYTAVAEFRIVFSLNIFSSKGAQLSSH